MRPRDSDKRDRYRSERQIAVDELFEMHVPLRAEFATTRNRYDVLFGGGLCNDVHAKSRPTLPKPMTLDQRARAELDSLIRIVNAILHDRLDTPSKQQNKDLLALHRSAYLLRQELSQHGFEAVLQHVGHYFGDVTFDNDEHENPTWELLTRLSRDLDSLLELTNVEQMGPQKGGNPGDARRLRAAKECETYFVRWTGLKPSASDYSKFNAFLCAIFQHLNQQRATNLRGLIEKLG